MRLPSSITAARLVAGLLMVIAFATLPAAAKDLPVPASLMRELRAIVQQPGFAPPWPGPVANDLVVIQPPRQGRTEPPAERLVTTWRSTFVGPTRFTVGIDRERDGTPTESLRIDALGGLIWIGQASFTGAVFNGLTVSVPTVFPLRVGQTFSVTRRANPAYSNAAPAGFEFEVLHRLDTVQGFEWLPGPFYVVEARQQTLPAGERIGTGRSLFSEAANVVVATYRGEQVSMRVAGLTLGGRRLGLSPEEAERQGRRLLARLRADVEAAEAGTTASARPSVPGTKADNEPAPATAPVAPVETRGPTGSADMWCPALVKVASPAGSNHWVMYVSPTFQVPVAALIKDSLADAYAAAFARHVTANVQRMHTWVEALLPLQCGHYIPGTLQFHPKTREAFIENQRSRVSPPHRFTSVDVDWVLPR